MPKMLRKRKKPGGQPGVSKYAQKKAAVARGISDPFEFQSKPRKEAEVNPTQTTQKSNQVNIAPGRTRILWGTVTRIEIEKKFIQLRTLGGNARIFMWLLTFRKSYQEIYLKIGSRLKYKVLMQTNGKGLIVTKVIDVRNAALNKEDANLRTLK